jgi:RNA polymerase sigma-70 factor (ECF subfamily)
MDDNALDRLFASCMPKLARTARQMLRNAQDSEDVLQEGLLSALQKLHQFQGRSKFSTWLHSIIRNEAKMHFRKMGSRQFYSIDQESSEQPGLFLENACDPKPDAEEACAENERSRILRTTLTQLPPMYRSVLQLCDIEGLGGRDAAATLGMTMSSLKTCLHRARRLVSNKIQQRYLPGANDARGRGASKSSANETTGMGTTPKPGWRSQETPSRKISDAPYCAEEDGRCRSTS